MTAISVYLFFVGALAGYRSSKYWPSDVKAMPWLGKFWWSWGGVILGTILLSIEKGLTIGILSSLCAFMTLSCCIIFFAHFKPFFRLTVLILFHVVCILGLISKF